MLQCAVNGLQLNTPRVARTHPQRWGGLRNEPTADKILISPRINLVLPKPTSNGGTGFPLTRGRCEEDAVQSGQRVMGNTGLC